MIFRRWLKAIILVMAGADSSVEGLASAVEVARRAPEAIAGDDDRPAPSPRLLWSPGTNQHARAAVELVGADPVAVRLLARSDLTIDRWNSFLAVRVVPATESATSDS